MKLIKLYCYISDRYDTELRWHCQRFSNNNSERDFTDPELLTVYIFAIIEEEKTKVKSIHSFAKRHLSDWFPDLPSYQAFNRRLNRIAHVFPYLVALLLSDMDVLDLRPDVSLVDSMPVITCSGKREGKVAKELTSKGYCSTKKLHYYGVKLHGIAFCRPGGLPVPEYLLATNASEHDLNAVREILSGFHNRTVVADKAYADKSLERAMARNRSELLTPVKAVKGETVRMRQYKHAADKLYSRAVSKIRQPIESFFNWVNEKTDIQKASRVRSANGLIVHIFGKLAAAICFWVF